MTWGKAGRSSEAGSTGCSEAPKSREKGVAAGRKDSQAQVASPTFPHPSAFLSPKAWIQVMGKRLPSLYLADFP